MTGRMKQEIDALIAATERAHFKLRETWRKVENLEAAVDTARRERSHRQEQQSNRQSKPVNFVKKSEGA